MSRRCDLLLDKKVLVGNNVSHANNRTRRRFLPNIHNMTFLTEKLGKIKMKISTKALRTINCKGGLEAFLMNAKTKELTIQANKIKKALELKLAK